MNAAQILSQNPGATPIEIEGEIIGFTDASPRQDDESAAWRASLEIVADALGVSLDDAKDEGLGNFLARHVRYLREDGETLSRFADSLDSDLAMLETRRWWAPWTWCNPYRVARRWPAANLFDKDATVSVAREKDGHWSITVQRVEVCGRTYTFVYGGATPSEAVSMAIALQRDM